MCIDAYYAFDIYYCSEESNFIGLLNACKMIHKTYQMRKVN